MLEKRLHNVSDNISGYYKVFNNCREQGLMLELNDDYESELLIWACENRNSDEIMVIIGDKSCCNSNCMFDDKAWKSAKYFNVRDYDSAVDYTYNVIKKQFNKNFLEEYATKFKMYKCLNDIQHIAIDTSDLEYEDYYDLATFEDVNKSYFCNLIISDGKLGLRYSKYKNKDLGEFYNLTFEEWNPDLTSSTTLMLGMQERLKNFIDSEIDYEIDMSINI